MGPNYWVFERATFYLWMISGDRVAFIDTKWGPKVFVSDLDG